MAPQNEENHVPGEVTEAATLAAQLHEQLFPVETLEEPAPEAEPAKEEPAQEPAPVADEETFEKRYKTLEGKYKAEVPNMAAQIRQLKQDLAAIQQAAPLKTETTEVPQTNDQLEEVLANLRKEYPDELIDNIQLLTRLEAERIANKAVKPFAESHASNEEALAQAKVNEFVTTISTAAPSWEEIWNVANDLFEGVEPSDPAIAEFLTSSDPSGLYTNLELLDMYNTKFDSARFAKVCNMYTTTPVQPTNPSRDALLAPSRSTSQPVVTETEPKIWTMAQIEQFQRDKRSEKYTEEQAVVIWEDIQKALAENRIR